MRNGAIFVAGCLLVFFNLEINPASSQSFPSEYHHVYKIAVRSNGQVRFNVARDADQRRVNFYPGHGCSNRSWASLSEYLGTPVADGQYKPLLYSMASRSKINVTTRGCDNDGIPLVVYMNVER